MASYSVIIRNGHIIDGKKNRLFRGDVAIKNERIEKIGTLTFDQAETEIDASNLYVAPGFIDLTNHSDTYWTLFDSPEQKSLLLQGITTVLGGNCGTSLSPLISGDEIDALQKWTDISTINVNWQSTEEFFEEMEHHRFGVNFAALIGLGTLRRGVIANITAPASNQEAGKMKYLLESAFSAGAFGLSTSLGRSHEQAAGKEELAMLAETIYKNGGIIKHHLRNEGADILPSVSEVISLAREIENTRTLAETQKKGKKEAAIKERLHTQISHFKILGKSSWKFFDEAIAMIERARHDNISIALDIFPYTKTGSNLYLILPLWAREGGKEKILTFLRDEAQRRYIAEELKGLTLHYDKMIIASTLRDKTAVGKTIDDLSSQTGLSPEDVIIDLLAINNLNVSIFNEVISEEHLIKLAHKEYVMFSSDGIGFNSERIPSHTLPHPRSFGAFPKVLRYFVKEKRVLGWEEAIHKMTMMPAQALGLSDRGTIDKNMHADIVVFDPEKIGDNATYVNPLQYASGINWVLVNGKVSVREGEIANDMNGHLIRKPLY